MESTKANKFDLNKGVSLVQDLESQVRTGAPVYSFLLGLLETGQKTWQAGLSLTLFLG